MQLFNLNRTFKYALSGLWSGGPYAWNSSKELFVFLFDGTEGVPASADDVHPNPGNPSGVDNFQNYAKNCFAYGILSGQSTLATDTDVGYRANTQYLTLKHPVIKPETAGFLDFTGASVTVPEHLAYSADWINGTGVGTGTEQPSIQSMNKMFALNPSVSKLSNPYLGLGFGPSLTLADFTSLVFIYNEPITVDCFVMQAAKQGASSNTFNRFAVQYLNESDVWVTLGTTPAISATVDTYSNRFLQFAPVTATQFRLSRTTAKTGVRNEVYRQAYFGNTDVSSPAVFTYPSTVYGLIAPNIAVQGQINFNAVSVDLSNGLVTAAATPVSRAVVGAANIDYAGNSPVLGSMPSFLVDVTDIAGSGRVKIPTLNTDPRDYFGFNNVIVDLL